MTSALRAILTGDPALAPTPSLADWLSRELKNTEKSPFDRALLGGFAADRLGYAFASGYRAALFTLVPSLSPECVPALAVTEEGGNAPRAIATELRRGAEGLTLRGSKRWTTFGTRADTILVAARDGERDGRPNLVLLRVASGAPGVRATAMPDAPFVPEIPHATLELDDVRVGPDAVLPGDGFDLYVKPFRTIEDLFVNAAGLAYLVGVARRYGASPSWLERAAFALTGLGALATAAPDAAETHVALAGALSATAALRDELAPLWASADADERARWERDQTLFRVASSARERRLERAWERLRAGDRSRTTPSSRDEIER